jgi:hypothetical protein
VRAQPVPKDDLRLRGVAAGGGEDRYEKKGDFLISIYIEFPKACQHWLLFGASAESQGVITKNIINRAILTL